MSSTFSQPIRVFKRNNPTNNGTIAPDNTGAVRVSQQAFIAPITAPILAGALPTFEIGTTTATPFVLPAGAIIEDIRFYQTVAPSATPGGTVTVNILVTDPVTGVVTTTALGTLAIGSTTGGITTMTLPATAAGAALWANVGPLDVTLTFVSTAIASITGTIAGTFSVDYTARNADGSITAYGSNLTNQ